MLIRFKIIIVLYGILLFGVNTYAQKAYVSTNDGAIYKIDISNCSSELIVQGSIFFGDIAIDPVTGQLYGVQVNVNPNNGDLYRIDVVSGEMTLIGSTNENFTALVGSSSGMLYASIGGGGSGKHDDIYLIDPETAEISVVGSMETSRGSKGDLTFYNEKLYLSAQNNHLVEMDLNNVSEANILGEFQNMSQVLGISSIGCPEQLFAYDGTDVHRLSPDNLLESELVCPNIVPSFYIGGAASINETVFDSVRLPEDTLLCSGDALTLDVTMQSDLFDYYWQGNRGNAMYAVDGPGTYIVTVESDGCATSDTIMVDFEDCENSCNLYLANAFTPGKDDVNDEFIPIFNCIGNGSVEAYSFQIYNRWGEKVFETDNITQGWNGTGRGSEAPSGVYTYVIDYQQLGGEKVRKTDKVLLIR